jgi:exopolyphosphatase/guanosine-5'-triphosphate,3'-diphosphate pyrophosphatase
VIDLGSNSFRLELSTQSKGKFKRLAYYKEAVRLGAGLDKQKNLTPSALENGFACLRRFAEALAQAQPDYVRAIATQTLREAKNAALFTQEAETILGCPLHIISGREEARLIYQGVSSRLPAGEEKRLVIDIGGRSTEIISGRGKVAQVAESFPIGSVSMSQQFFPEGVLSKAAFAAAQRGAQAVWGDLRVLYPQRDWSVAYGSAGTTSAVADILQAAGFAADAVTLAGLDWLEAQMLQAGSSAALQLPGLKEDRRPVLGGGFATLRALFVALDIHELKIVSGALRHGVLQELLKSAAVSAL